MSRFVDCEAHVDLTGDSEEERVEYEDDPISDFSNYLSAQHVARAAESYDPFGRARNWHERRGRRLARGSSDERGSGGERDGDDDRRERIPETPPREIAAPRLGNRHQPAPADQAEPARAEPGERDAPAPAAPAGRGSGSRHWSWTWNSRAGNGGDGSDLPGPEEVRRGLERHCDFAVWQHERGADGRHHLQGHIYARGKIRFTSVKLWLRCEHLHCEIARNPKASIDYCQKSDSRVAGPWRIGVEPAFGSGGRSDLVRLYEKARSGFEAGRSVNDLLLDEDSKIAASAMRYTKELERLQYAIEEKKNQELADPPPEAWRDWQTEALRILDSPPDNRSVYWIYDEVGHTGKSVLSAYLANHRKYFLSGMGKSEDLAYAWSQTFTTHNQGVVFDIPRSANIHESFYLLLEMFKNKRVTVNKYQSRTMCFARPMHVIVFANQPPDVSKLSADRWRVNFITNFLTLRTVDHRTLFAGHRAI